MNYIIYFDIAAIALSAVTLLHYYGKKNIKTRQNRVFKWLLFFNFASSVLDIITAKFYEIRPSVEIGYVVNVIYLLMFSIMPFIYLMYLIYSVDIGNKSNMLVYLIVSLPLFADLMLIISTPWTGYIFEYDISDCYTFGPLHSILYIFSVTYILMSFLVSIIYRYKFTGKQRASITFYTAICISAGIIQLIYPEILIVHYAAALAVLVCYLAIENTDDDEDKEFNIYNRKAFMKRININVKSGKKFRILGLNIIGYSAIADTIGVQESQQVLKNLITTVKGIAYPMDMFSVAQGQFAFYTDNMSLDEKAITKNIQEVFKTTFRYNGMGVALGAGMYHLEFPKDVSRIEDIMDIMAYSAEKKRNAEGDTVINANSEILIDRRRQNQVKQILRQAVLNKKFQVYYQPIYSVAEGKFTSAEALVRLYDEELGFISPEEFIPMAEKNGLILEIGEFVFREVCRMFSEYKLNSLGIKYVEVNLSVVQCMQEKLSDILIGIMDEYNVPYECINLEITETATTVNMDVLKNNMSQLMSRGITFSLDDYGTGYSNTTNVIKYPFYIIKLDKSMVWTAMENERAKSALKHTVAMIKDLGMHIVAEGVETEEHIRVLSEMGCDYLQGFYFSKPVPDMQFITCVKHGNGC